MEWIKCNSVDELKRLGSFKEVKQMIKESCNGLIEVKSRGWNDLYKKIEKIEEFVSSFGVNINGENIKDGAGDNKCIVKEEGGELFTSKASEYIFYLLKLDGEERLKKLRANKTHYNNKEKARKWKNDIAKIIHYDKCHHPMSNEATSTLMDIYRGMIGNE